jgi:hypothetical protein
MSFASIVSTVESKIAELQTQVKTHSGFLTEIGQALEKFAADKLTTNNNLNILNGAIQAYNDVLKVVKDLEGQSSASQSSDSSSTSS